MTLVFRLVRISLVACLWILASPNNLVAQVQDSADVGRSTVRGTVTYADTGRPIRNASVNMMADDNGTVIRDVVTNGRGQFVFQYVDAGRYLLYVSSPGILFPAAYQRQTGSVSAQLRLNDKRDLFTEVVVNGTESVEVKVQGFRGGVITGRVLTEDDQPVANADVRLLRRVNGKWLPEGVWSRGSTNRHISRTDPSGVYRIAGLEAGDYIVRVSEPTLSYDSAAHTEDAYSNGSLMVVYHPSATGIKEGQAVSVIEGSESSGIDIRMPERIPRTISGTVTYGADDQPAGFIGVLIERREEDGFHSVLDTTVRADDEGKWSVKGVPAGQYVLRFDGSVRIGTGEAGGHVYVAPKQVAVTVANDDVVINTRVQPGAFITGTIKIDGPQPASFYEFTPAVVLADEGSEVPPSNQDARSKRDYESGYVRERGKFEINELSGGKYWFLMPGFQADRYYVKSVTRKGVDLARSPFRVVAGGVLDGVIVTLGTDVATIEGQLSDFNPKTSRREVIVTLAPANDATRRFNPALVTAHPDGEGRFVFTCGPGEYLVTVNKGAQRRVTVKAGEKIKIRV